LFLILDRDTGKSGGAFGITRSMIQFKVCGRVEVTVKSGKEMGVTPAKICMFESTNHDVMRTLNLDI